MLMAHGGGFGVWRVFADLFGCEFGKGVKIASIDGVSPRGDDRRVKRGMIKRDAGSEVWKVYGISGLWT
jgi:hypothetical protein